MQPEPASASSSSVQPSRWVMCPITHPSPMTVGNPGPAWITVPSWMDEPAPIVMVPKSPRKTACGHTLDSAPMVTSPMTTASGWMKASAWIRGATPSSSYTGMRRTLYVGRDPGHTLVPAVAEIDDAGHQHQLEVPRNGLTLLLRQDGAAGRALTFLAQIL